MLNHFRKALIAIGSVGFAATLIAGEGHQLMPLKEGELGSNRVIEMKVAGKRAMPTVQETQPVSFTFPVTEDAQIETQYIPYVAQSRGFSMRISNEDLYQGFVLPTTQSGALVRIDALANEKGLETTDAVYPRDLILVTPQGRAFSDGSGMNLLANVEEMEAVRKSGFSFATSSFRISEQLGNGEMMIYSENVNLDEKREFMVQVLERDSQFQMNVQAKSDLYLAGQRLAFEFDMLKANTAIDAQFSAHAISPSGKTYNVEVKGNRAYLNTDASFETGLYDLRVTGLANDGDLTIRRDGTTAFQVSLPVARFTGAVELEDNKEGIRAAFDVEVAQKGRYEVRAILFAADANGEMKPVSVAHQAAVIDTGLGVLELEFDRAALEAQGFVGPFELRDLRLIHQNTMGIVHRQATALRF